MTILECKHIELTKNNQTILTDISFEVQAGDSIGFMGPSGSGKSSLFRLLNLLSSPTEGDIFYKNKILKEYPPTQLRCSIGYVLQKPYLFGTKVEENLTYPYELHGKKVNFTEIHRYLEQVKLEKSILQKKNTALSGGEQQRIALIRSLLMKPEILLLDEVTAALDEENTLLLEQLVIDEQQRENLTLLLITHNIQQAKRLTKKILYLEAGRISFWGPTAEFSNEKGEYHEQSLTRSHI